MRKHKHGGRPQFLHDRIPMLISFERARLREYEELCNKSNISISEGIRQLIEETLEKNEVGLANPCNIPYGGERQKLLAESNPIETLDYFIESGQHTIKQWNPAFEEIDDKERLDRYENLITIMQTSVKNRKFYLKTGKRNVISGTNLQIPTFKDMGSKIVV